MSILEFRQVPDQGLPARLSDAQLSATIATEVSTPGSDARDELDTIYASHAQAAGAAAGLAIVFGGL